VLLQEVGMKKCYGSGDSINWCNMGEELLMRWKVEGG
jgi:hypothetical protein